MIHRGNLSAFRTLFEELYPGLVRVALFYINDQAIAEDITQEVFTKLWEKRDALQKINNIKSYLQNSVKNNCLNYIEHQQVIDKYHQEYLSLAKEEEEDSQEEYINRVYNLLNKLPEKRRMVLEMSIVESKSYQEIADELQISINTVKDHIKKAYAFLRAEVQKEISDSILLFAFLWGKKKLRL